MRKTTHNILYPFLLWVFLMLALVATGNRELHSSATHVPRGIAGLELGMTPEQVGQLFTIKEDIDPLAALLTKYGKPEAGEAVSRQNKALKKRFFHIQSGIKQLPDDATSADVRTTYNVVYQIGFHYNESSVKKIGWKGVTSPYLAKYGKPTKDTGSGYIWDDGRTRLDIGLSGKTINVFFTDQALETEVKKGERETP
ncbi:MAG: hypothetical protein NT178_18740 [Proteobacteria bacterium]|nr:hypothetical protein [Pseudomonadota bacterium]